MDTVIPRPDRRHAGLDLKTCDVPLKLCDTIFQPEHVVATRIVHAECLGPFIHALPKALEHRCALLQLIIAVTLSPVSREPALTDSRQRRSGRFFSASPSARQGSATVCARARLVATNRYRRK